MSQTLYSRLLTAGLVLLVIWLVSRYLLPLIAPFLLGAVLALLAEPVVSMLRRRMGLPRGLASGIGVAMTFCLLALAVFLIGALILRELGVVAGVLPDLGAMAKEGLTSLGSWLQGLTRYVPGSLGEYLSRSIGEFFSGGTALLDRAFSYVLGLAGTILSHVPDSALSLGTAILSGYMISFRLPRFRRWLLRRIPKERLLTISATFRRVRTLFFGWLKAQLKLMGVTCIILFLGLTLLRIPYALLWSLGISLVDAFPVLGTGTVLLPWSLLCLLQGDAARAIGLAGIYVTITLLRSVLEPKFLGRHLGMDPLVTLIAIYVGYKLWGIGGMILEPSGEGKIYYGAADTVECVATADVNDLIRLCLEGK
mgnify:CR=1 FL=1